MLLMIDILDIVSTRLQNFTAQDVQNMSAKRFKPYKGINYSILIISFSALHGDSYQNEILIFSSYGIIEQAYFNESEFKNSFCRK